MTLTLLHSEWPKLHRVLAILSAVGLNMTSAGNIFEMMAPSSVLLYEPMSILECFQLISHRNRVNMERYDKAVCNFKF